MPMIGTTCRTLCAKPQNPLHPTLRHSSDRTPSPALRFPSPSSPFAALSPESRWLEKGWRREWESLSRLPSLSFRCSNLHDKWINNKGLRPKSPRLSDGLLSRLLTPIPRKEVSTVSIWGRTPVSFGDSCVNKMGVHGVHEQTGRQHPGRRRCNFF